MENKSFLKWALAIVLIYAIFMTLFSVNKNDYAEAKKIELERESARLKAKEDSLRIHIKELQAQDLRALKVIQEATIRADRAEKKLQIANDKIRKINFVRFANDTVRSSEISNLYPSVRNR